jgi:hypothetical protein
LLSFQVASREEALAQERRRREELAYKRSFFVRMVSDPKIYNPKMSIARRHVSAGEDVQEQPGAEEDEADADAKDLQRPMFVFLHLFGCRSCSKIFISAPRGSVGRSRSYFREPSTKLRAPRSCPSGNIFYSSQN